MGGGEEKVSGGARLTASEAPFGIQGKSRHPDGPSSCCKAALISAVERKRLDRARPHSDESRK